MKLLELFVISRNRSVIHQMRNQEILGLNLNCLKFEAILLKPTKLTVETLRQALIEFDETIVAPETLKHLITFSPDSDEVLVVTNISDDIIIIIYNI